MKMNHHIIFIFFAIVILCNASKLISADEEAPIAKPLEEPQGNGRKRRPPPPPSPPPPPLSFDHFKLAQTWPVTFCKIPGNTCIDNWPMRFLIHGLWPGKNGVELKDCDKDKKMDEPIFGDIAGIKSKLDQDWPSLYKNKFPVIANKKLWFHEWHEHGTCSAQLFNFVKYLDTAIKLYRKNKIVDILQKKGIVHGKLFSRDDIFSAIFYDIGFKPQIKCVKIQTISYLLEVRLCFTPTQDPQYTHCDGYGNPFVDCEEDVYI